MAEKCPNCGSEDVHMFAGSMSARQCADCNRIFK